MFYHLGFSTGDVMFGVGVYGKGRILIGVLLIKTPHHETQLREAQSYTLNIRRYYRRHFTNDRFAPEPPAVHHLCQAFHLHSRSVPNDVTGAVFSRCTCGGAKHKVLRPNPLAS